MFERYPIVGEIVIILAIATVIFAIYALIELRKFSKEQKNLEK